MFALKSKLTTTETATREGERDSNHAYKKALKHPQIVFKRSRHALIKIAFNTRNVAQSPKPQRCHRTTNNYLPATAVVFVAGVAGVMLLLLLLLALWPATHHHTLCCSRNKSVAS